MVAHLEHSRKNLCYDCMNDNDSRFFQCGTCLARLREDAVKMAH
jgi:hypothetical protein